MSQLLFPLLLVALLVPMFLGVRRQRREAANTSTMQQSLKVGDRVTTTSGLYGTVVDLDETTVDLEIAEDVVTTWLRAAVREVRPDAAEGDSAAEADTEVHDAEGAAPDTETTAVEPHAANGATRPAETASNGNHDAPVEESVEDTSARLTKD
jgi:preprotein translocase subunit YajC